MEGAKKPVIVLGGFNGLESEDEPFITAAENRSNTQMVIRDWMLGPEKPTNERGANKPYWMALGKAMQVSETEARRRRCSNCEYYDNTPETQAKMDAIPWNAWDVAAGFRGYCTKFDFVCHDLRSCQAWEEREFEDED
jgi:hypothetical protein